MAGEELKKDFPAEKAAENQLTNDISFGDKRKGTAE
jgi:hypothetical protein